MNKRLLQTIFIASLIYLLIFRPDANATDQYKLVFDMDGVIIHLLTKNYLYHKVTGQEIALNNTELAAAYGSIGKIGPYQDYEITKATFRETGSALVTPSGLFRVDGQTASTSLREQYLEAIEHHSDWKGPLFDFFINMLKREHDAGDVEVIISTARGISREELFSALAVLVEKGYTSYLPQWRNSTLGKNPLQNPLLQPTDQFKATDVIKRIQKDINDVSASRYAGGEKKIHWIFFDDTPKNVQTMYQNLSRAMLRSRKWQKFLEIHAIEVGEANHQVFGVKPNGIVSESVCRLELNALPLPENFF